MNIIIRIELPPGLTKKIGSLTQIGTLLKFSIVGLKPRCLGQNINLINHDNKTNNDNNDTNNKTNNNKS